MGGGPNDGVDYRGMNMRHGGKRFGWGATTQQSPRHDPPWEKTPWWNWHRWCGFDLRRWIDTDRPDLVSPWWEYARAKTAARKILEERFNVNERV